MSSIRIGLAVCLATALLAAQLFADSVDPTSEEELFGDDSGIEADSGIKTNTGIEADFEDESFFLDPFSTSETGEDEFSDFDSLFDDEMIEVVEDPDAARNPENDLLQSDRLEWGGRISGSAGLEWSWNTTVIDEIDLFDPTRRTLTPSINADLFFDGRPNSDFRAFGKLKIGSSGDGGVDLAGTINQIALTGDLPEGWTREEQDGETVIRDEDGEVVFTIAAEDDEPDEPQTGSPPTIDISVYELFSDFNYKNRLFFRFGKHTIKWGVGYFFSPADVLNLTAVDSEDPTADREGPVSLKSHLPFGTSNAYLFLVTNSDAKPLEIAVAPKIEFVAGSTEFALAAYYQQALAPRLIGMFTSSISDLDLFGEALISLGSDRVFVRESLKTIESFDDPPDGLEVVLDTYTVDWLPLFSGTIGGRYLYELDNDLGSIVLLGQYFFNGEGYPDSSLLKPAAFLFQNGSTNGLAIPNTEAQPEGYQEPPSLRFTDISNWGRHYVAANFGWSKIATSNISVSLFALANLSDLSGIVSPAIQFPLLEAISVSLSGRLTFGGTGDEYTNPGALLETDASDRGGTFSASLSFGLGGGSF